jgi:hypothetical protein
MKTLENGKGTGDRRKLVKVPRGFFIRARSQPPRDKERADDALEANGISGDYSPIAR